MITTTIIFLSFLVLFCWIQRYIIINLSVSSYSEKITTKQPTKQPTQRKPTDICILIYSYSLYMLNFEIVYHIHNPQKECYLEAENSWQGPKCFMKVDDEGFHNIFKLQKYSAMYVCVCAYNQKIKNLCSRIYCVRVFVSLSLIFAILLSFSCNQLKE